MEEQSATGEMPCKTYFCVKYRGWVLLLWRLFIIFIKSRRKPACMTFFSRISLLFLVALLLTIPLSAGSDPDLNEEAIKARIDSLKSQVVSPRYDAIVKSYIRTYTVLQRDKAERILGRRLIYFPIIEDYLRKHGLPEDLKYLPIVESALEARAVSHAGAVGLWQFMSETGRYYGLEITNQVDERCDPYRSTEAAMDYLSVLYDRFQDWELAIAAYNSGGGRVSRAIKRARSKDFWRVKRYLPRETANYVPAFVAATYLLKHYEAHDLQPRIPSLDAQLNRRIMLKRPFSFYEIAQISGATLEAIEFLNPAYTQSYIPASAYRPRSLVLPQRNMIPLQAFLEAEKTEQEKQAAFARAPVFISQSENRIQNAYTEELFLLRRGESLDALAERLEIPVLQIMAWNKLEARTFDVDKKIRIYRLKPLAPNPLNPEVAPLPPLDSPEIAKEPPTALPIAQKSIWEKDLERFLFQKEYLFYWNPKRQRVSDIAGLLPGISTEDIIELNEFKKDKVVRKNDRIRIKKMSR